MKMTNRWNRFIYRLWAPVYDATVDRFFRPGRRQALRLLNLKPRERVLLVGVGTGADLPLLPKGVEANGMDLSPEMLARAQSKLPLPGCSVMLIRGDAQQPFVKETSFEAVVFHLILSVIPDGEACLRENLHALKSGGMVVVFDKFVADGSRISPARRIINWFSTLLGTDINLRFHDLVAGSPCEIVRNEPNLLDGMYRVILLKKTVRTD